MNHDSTGDAGAARTVLASKAWTAYIRVAVVAILLALIVVLPLWTSSHVAGFGLLALVLAFVAYKVFEIRSHRLYVDDAGVWHERGILPWTRGVVGVKWRDIDEATFVQTMWSWMSGSYTVRVGHRFTKSSELLLSHMARGNDAVMAVNATHADMVSRNLLS